MHTLTNEKDNACKGRRVCVSRRKLQLARAKKKARPFEYASSEKEKKKKKRNPETKSNGHRWSTGGARSKRVVSEFHKLHRNRPELRCNRVKSFETRNKIAARCDVTLNRGRDGR